MDGSKCIGDEPHVWAGFGHEWVCRVCGKPGVDCSACQGTGWADVPDGSIDEDCEKCSGTGVVPASQAADEGPVPS